ncbi:MAG: hypothetical protein V3S69_07370, partial [Dehalococcoidales bacterium]
MDKKNELYRCDNCLSRPMEEKKRQLYRQAKGCWGIDEPRHSIKDGDDTIFPKTCPGNIVDYGVISMLPMWDSYKSGVMPYPGSYSDQPAKLMEIFGVFDQWYTEKERKMAQEQSRR